MSTLNKPRCPGSDGRGRSQELLEALSDSELCARVTRSVGRAGSGHVKQAGYHITGKPVLRPRSFPSFRMALLSQERSL